MRDLEKILKIINEDCKDSLEKRASLILFWTWLAQLDTHPTTLYKDLEAFYVLYPLQIHRTETQKPKKYTLHLSKRIPIV